MKTKAAVSAFEKAAEAARERAYNDLAARLEDAAKRLEQAPPDPQLEEQLNA